MRNITCDLCKETIKDNLYKVYLCKEEDLSELSSLAETLLDNDLCEKCYNNINLYLTNPK